MTPPAKVPGHVPAAGARPWSRQGSGQSTAGGFADVVRVAVTKTGTTTRRCRYHADGTVEQLWKNEGKPDRRGRAAAQAWGHRRHRHADEEERAGGRPEWRPVKCPVCGRECWERPGVMDAMKKNPKLMAACTEVCPEDNGDAEVRGSMDRKAEAQYLAAAVEAADIKDGGERRAFVLGR